MIPRAPHLRLVSSQPAPGAPAAVSQRRRSRKPSAPAEVACLPEPKCAPKPAREAARVNAVDFESTVIRDIVEAVMLMRHADRAALLHQIRAEKLVPVRS